MEPASPPAKLVQGSRLKLRLAGGSLAVLGVGALLGPRPTQRSTPPRETMAPILQAEVDRREPARVFRGVQDLGRKALDFAVAFEEPAPARPVETRADFETGEQEMPLPAGFGIAVPPGRILTHAGALGGRNKAVVRLADASRLTARVVAYESVTGLALLEPERAIPPRFLATLAESRPAPGELVVAAARLDGRDFVAPVFVASVAAESYVISAASGIEIPGTPLFNLSGQALAVTAGRPALSEAFPVRESVVRLERLLAEGRGSPRSIGVLLQPLTPELARLLGAGAALLSDVAPDGPAQRAGLRPGDVLLRIGEGEVAGLDEALERIASLEQPTPFTIRRAGRERTVGVEPEARLAPRRVVRLAAAPAEAPAAGALLPAARLADAGIPEDALILAVDGVSVGGSEAARARLARRGPRLLRLQHAARRFFAVVDSGS